MPGPKGPSPSDAPHSLESDGACGEFRGSPRMGTAVISGATFAQKSVVYYDVGGIAVVEGDIALGRTEEVVAAMDAMRDAATNPMISFGVGLPAGQFRWPNCQVPYEIDPNLPNKQRVTDAIAHWEANTAFRFPQRTTANASQYPNYVRFTDAGGCWSLVGMRGGQQTISLGPGCTTGSAIHEIGHAIGLWHEQSREDRDAFVTIHWANIADGMAAQFNQHITDGDDLGAYDYGSIMHYPRKAFSKNGQDTIVPADPNAQIGQRTGLSAGDIAAVRALYPACGVVVKPPWQEGGAIKKLRDDRPPFKKLLDDGRPKKLRDDIIGKPVRDPKPVLDPGPIKNTLDPLPVHPGTLPRPGTLQPFSMATPHHAALAAAGGMAYAGGAPCCGGGGIELQMLDLEAALAEARATAARANAEIARLQQASEALAGAYEQAMNPSGGPP